MTTATKLRTSVRLPFWAFQITGWLGFLAVHFLSGMAHGKHISYLSVSISSAIGGAIVTWPLHWLYKRICNLPPMQTAMYALPAFVLIVAAMSVIYAISIENYCPDECKPASFLGYMAYSGFTAYVILSWSALWFGIHNGRELAAARERALAAQSQANLAQLKMLRYQLNPHFLFNTLNSLLMLTRKDSQRAQAALLGFARLMRYVLDTKRGSEGRVSLAEELDFVRDYLALETLRLGERLRVRWQVDEAALEESLPPLTLQPLVENAIAHGIAPQVAGGELHIEARCEGDWLHLSVQDDGPGCPWPPAPGGRLGLGLSTLQRRFEIDYEGRARLTVRSAPGTGFAVDILIPRA